MVARAYHAEAMPMQYSRPIDHTCGSASAFQALLEKMQSPCSHAAPQPCERPNENSGANGQSNEFAKQLVKTVGEVIQTVIESVTQLLQTAIEGFTSLVQEVLRVAGPLLQEAVKIAAPLLQVAGQAALAGALLA